MLATRSLTWTESFARAALFLSTLSAAVIVLGLVGPATQFGPEFFAFALVLLPVALFVGIATFLRIDEGNREDIFWIAGMNRIRHAYVRMRPAATPFLILGTTDDVPGITRSFGPLAGTYSFAHFFVTIPGMIAVIDGVLAGAIAGMATTFTGASIAALIAVGATVGVFTAFLLARVSQRGFLRLMETQKPAFPSEESSPGWARLTDTAVARFRPAACHGARLAQAPRARRLVSRVSPDPSRSGDRAGAVGDWRATRKEMARAFRIRETRARLRLSVRREG